MLVNISIQLQYSYAIFIYWLFVSGFHAIAVSYSMDLFD